MGQLQAWKLKILEEDELDFKTKIRPLISQISIDNKIVEGDLISYKAQNGDSSNYLILFWWESSASLKEFKSHLATKYDSNYFPEEFKEMYLELEHYFNDGYISKIDNDDSLKQVSALIQNQEYLESKL